MLRRARRSDAAVKEVLAATMMRTAGEISPVAAKSARRQNVSDDMRKRAKGVLVASPAQAIQDDLGRSIHARTVSPGIELPRH
jgi:hypothetical protein